MGGNKDLACKSKSLACDFKFRAHTLYHVHVHMNGIEEEHNNTLVG